MEIFELGIERIHQLISDCCSSAIIRGLLFSVVALLIGFLFLYIGKRFNFFYRENRVLRTIVKGYYIYIPLILTLGGFTTGATLATKDFFAVQTKKNIALLIKFVFPDYQSSVNTNWARVVQTRMTFSETVDEYVGEIEFSPRNNAWQEQFFTYAANTMVPKITKWGIESVIGAAKDIALKQAEKQGYIETNKTQALTIVRTMSIFKYPPGLWEEANQQLENKAVLFFADLAGTLFIIFSLLLFIPFAEIIIYKIYSRRKLSIKYCQNGSSDKNHTTASNREVKVIKQPKTVHPAVEMDIPKVFQN